MELAWSNELGAAEVVKAGTPPLDRAPSNEREGNLGPLDKVQRITTEELNGGSTRKKMEQRHIIWGCNAE